jgi:threonyl-tRNA synthetase
MVRVKIVQFGESKLDIVYTFKHTENNNQTGKGLNYMVKIMNCPGSCILKVQLQQKGHKKFSG